MKRPRFHVAASAGAPHLEFLVCFYFVTNQLKQVELLNPSYQGGEGPGRDVCPHRPVGWTATPSMHACPQPETSRQFSRPSTA